MVGLIGSNNVCSEPFIRNQFLSFASILRNRRSYSTFLVSDNTLFDSIITSAYTSSFSVKSSCSLSLNVDHTYTEYSYEYSSINIIDKNFFPDDPPHIRCNKWIIQKSNILICDLNPLDEADKVFLDYAKEINVTILNLRDLYRLLTS